ncbi:hypothetical protein [Pasteuria penetrans]|uniref:hypothetical protein n=1 Tax=Pasteuria penetrans TaxID=86005 RepID=UPI0011EE76BD|nr:hypothetical protein [Pasteuria penetrans]
MALGEEGEQESLLAGLVIKEVGSEEVPAQFSNSVSDQVKDVYAEKFADSFSGRRVRLKEGKVRWLHFGIRGDAPLGVKQSLLKFLPTGGDFVSVTEIVGADGMGEAKGIFLVPMGSSSAPSMVFIEEGDRMVAYKGSDKISGKSVARFKRDSCSLKCSAISGGIGYGVGKGADFACKLFPWTRFWHHACGVGLGAGTGLLGHYVCGWFCD